MSMPFGEDVERARRKMVIDQYSELPTQGSWDDPELITIEGAAIAPSSTTSYKDATRASVTTSMSFYCLQTDDVQDGDRITARTGTWEVQGDCLVFTNPLTGWEPGAEFFVQRIKG